MRSSIPFIVSGVDMVDVIKVYSNETFSLSNETFSYYFQNILGHVCCDPVHKVADLCVDARVEISPTSNTPAHNTLKRKCALFLYDMFSLHTCEVSRAILIVAKHGATRVTLATVLA